MKTDLHCGDGSPSNVVSITSARRSTAKDKRHSADGASARPALGQWLVGALMVMLAAGGVVALTVPLLRGAGILGG